MVFSENLYSSTRDAAIKVAEALTSPSYLINWSATKDHNQFWSNSLATRPSLRPSYSSTAESRIFIHENLTAHRKEIVAEANRRRRDGTVLSILTLDGTIYVKTSPEGTPKKSIALRISTS